MISTRSRLNLTRKTKTYKDSAQQLFLQKMPPVPHRITLCIIHHQNVIIWCALIGQKLNFSFRLPKHSAKTHFSCRFLFFPKDQTEKKLLIKVVLEAMIALALQFGISNPENIFNSCCNAVERILYIPRNPSPD